MVADKSFSDLRVPLILQIKSNNLKALPAFWRGRQHRPLPETPALEPLTHLEFKDYIQNPGRPHSAIRYMNELGAPKVTR